MTALARQLQGRNHEVIFLYSSDAAGLPVFPGDQSSTERNSTDEAIAEVSKMQGEDALQFGIKAALGFTESVLNSLPATVAKTGVDALLIDTVYFYAELAKNAIIVQRVPQLELLKRTSVCITDAGLNTVLESLAQGVPQVAIPVTFDQPGVAARIAHKQTGVVTSLDKLTPDHLSERVGEVMNNSTYRANARKLQQAIASANGLSVAADLIEDSLGVTKKSSHAG